MKLPFRPARRVTDPAGQEWELYVSRVVLPAWREGGYNAMVDGPAIDSGATAMGSELMLLDLPFAFVGFLWSSILVPLLRLIFLMPFALVKGRGSHAARIQAMCFAPPPETRTWTTTIDQVDSVLEEIVQGLAQGKVVQPAGAVYSGSQGG